MTPKLAARYEKMAPDAMDGSKSAGELIKNAPIALTDRQLDKDVLRPGIIDWTTGMPVASGTGVWFDMQKAGMGQGVSPWKALNLGKILHSRYVDQDVSQGADVREFSTPAVSNAVKQDEATMVKKVKDAAAIEAKAKALAAKAKATKDAALAGLGYFADESVVQQVAAEEAAAKAAAVAPPAPPPSLFERHKLLFLLGLAAAAYLILKK